MAKLWKPSSPYYYKKPKKNFKIFRSKLFLQIICSCLFFLLIWGVYQFDGPIFSEMQKSIRTWFTEDTDITPVFKAIKEIGMYGDSFERAAYEVVSPSLETQPLEPMTIPVSGTVVKPYGWTMVQGQSTFHKGLVIEAPLGTPIKSAYAGTVLEIKNDDPQLGRVIVISHRDGLVTTYGYCSEILVRVDHQVEQGEVIAKVGQGLGSEKGQLYFEVNKLGEPVNPMDLLEINTGTIFIIRI